MSICFCFLFSNWLFCFFKKLGKKLDRFTSLKHSLHTYGLPSWQEGHVLTPIRLKVVLKCCHCTTVTQNKLYIINPASEEEKKKRILQEPFIDTIYLTDYSERKHNNNLTSRITKSTNKRIFLVAWQLAHVSHIEAASLDELFKPLLFFTQCRNFCRQSLSLAQSPLYLQQTAAPASKTKDLRGWITSDL